jgi:molybdopterin synthase sulfur carrier subunit
MKIELLYFGRPSESLKLARETVNLPAGISTLGELLAWLRLRGDIWAQELTESRVRCAINQEFAGLTAQIKEHDEIALFSPISGG